MKFLIIQGKGQLDKGVGGLSPVFGPSFLVCKSGRLLLCLAPTDTSFPVTPAT
jgi:hypothetical protein